MEFSERLNSYLQELDVSAKELSEESGVSQVVISRYRSGQRVPTTDNIKVLKDLALAIESLSKKKEIRLISASEVLEAFESDISELNIPFCADNFNKIVETFCLNASEMSHSMSYDPSYISRLRAGKRRPPHPDEFIKRLSVFLFPRIGKSIPAEAFYALIEAEPSEDHSQENLAELLRAFILKSEKSDQAISRFLGHMDDFNLEDYIKEIHFDDIKVPSVPFTFPKEKAYFGVEGQKEAELDIFKLIVLSKSKEPVFLYSDMDMEDMSKDEEFEKKWLFGLALMLKKGLTLKYIHNLNRPMSEMMIALENLIPLYMTGQIEPYYLPDRQEDAFRHIYRVGGSAAMIGMGIYGNHNASTYQVSTSKSMISEVKRQADDLLSHALPLMEIFNEEKRDLFLEFLMGFDSDHTNIRQILSGLPIYTMSEELLNKILTENNVSDKLKEDTMSYYKQIRRITENQLEEYTIFDEIPLLSKEEFEKYPLSIQIPGAVISDSIRYTYDEYTRHLKESEKYAESHKNYTMVKNKNVPFRNINILIAEGNYVWISKMKAPTIQFVIRHPELRKAIEQRYIPALED